MNIFGIITILLSFAAQLHAASEPTYIVQEIEDSSQKMEIELELESFQKELDPSKWKIAFPASIKNTHEQLKTLEKDFYQLNPVIEQEDGLFYRHEKYEKLKPQIALLKKLSVLHEIGSNKTLQTPRDINVSIRTNIIDTSMVEILNKDGVPRYQTHFSNITLLDKDLDLATHPLKYTTYPAQETLSKYDHDFQLSLGFLAHHENLESSYFANFLNKEIMQARGYRLEFRPTYATILNFSVGLSSSLSKGTITSEDFPNTYSSWYIGPILEHRTFEIGPIHLVTNASLQKSVKFQLTDQYYNYSFKQTIFQTGIEVVYPLKKGLLTAGLTYRLLNTSFANNFQPDQDVRITTNQNYRIIGFSVGYKYLHTIL